MAFEDDHTVWLEVMKHLKSNLDLYMVSQCNKKLNGLGWFSRPDFVTEQSNPGNSLYLDLLSDT